MASYMGAQRVPIDNSHVIALIDCRFAGDTRLYAIESTSVPVRALDHRPGRHPAPEPILDLTPRTTPCSTQGLC